MKNNQLTPNPPAIIQFAEVHSLSEMILYAQKEKAFQTNEELLNYITHNINNISHSDGRIYMSINKDGILFAHSVSPYSENFNNNIENGVKDLVNILRNKRYLTYSSCEGHGNSFRRYVGLAFPDEESREIVHNYITSLKIKGIFTKKFISVANQHADFSNQNDKITYEKKFDPTKLIGDELVKHREEEAMYFNASFHRKYSEYYFLEIVILEEITDAMFFKHPLKTIWLWFMKKYKWNKLTQQLVEELEKKSFPKFKY